MWLSEDEKRKAWIKLITGTWEMFAHRSKRPPSVFVTPRLPVSGFLLWKQRERIWLWSPQIGVRLCLGGGRKKKRLRAATGKLLGDTGAEKWRSISWAAAVILLCPSLDTEPKSFGLKCGNERNSCQSCISNVSQVRKLFSFYYHCVFLDPYTAYRGMRPHDMHTM